MSINQIHAALVRQARIPCSNTLWWMIKSTCVSRKGPSCSSISVDGGFQRRELGPCKQQKPRRYSCCMRANDMHSFVRRFPDKANNRKTKNDSRFLNTPPAPCFSFQFLPTVNFCATPSLAITTVSAGLFVGRCKCSSNVLKVSSKSPIEPYLR